jgi:ABC-type glycerol-3-phosphate transport system substrate-binding protein
MRLSDAPLAAIAALATVGALAACGQDTTKLEDGGATGTITYFTFSAAPTI